MLGCDVKVGDEEGGFRLENELGLAIESEEMLWLDGRLEEFEQKLELNQGMQQEQQCHVVSFDPKYIHT